MISDTQVVFRGVDHSQAVEEAVHKRAEKLERFSDQIQSLRVTVESPHNNHHKGKVYHVGVEAIIPNHDIVVNHDQHDKRAHEDIYVAIRDTFDAVERQIKEFYEKQRRQNRHKDKRLDLAPVMEGAVEVSDAGESINDSLNDGLNGSVIDSYNDTLNDSFNDVPDETIVSVDEFDRAKAANQ